MEKTNFWKDVAKYGAIIGALLAVSFMLETRLQISASFGLYAIEWIAVVVLHYYLLHRFTRRYSMMYTAEEGFSFGQGYAYILSVSTVAGCRPTWNPCCRRCSTRYRIPPNLLF